MIIRKVCSDRCRRLITINKKGFHEQAAGESQCDLLHAKAVRASRSYTRARVYVHARANTAESESPARYALHGVDSAFCACTGSLVPCCPRDRVIACDSVCARMARSRGTCVNVEDESHQRAGACATTGSHRLLLHPAPQVGCTVTPAARSAISRA